MNEKNLNWAKQHDWGQDAFLENGTIKNLLHSWRDRDGNFQEESCEFSDFKALREWAGY